MATEFEQELPLVIASETGNGIDASQNITINANGSNSGFGGALALIAARPEIAMLFLALFGLVLYFTRRK